jgi:predicted amidophosphoribosyltransferase
MNCPSCSAENGRADRFCAMCGGKLYLICPKCGMSNDVMVCDGDSFAEAVSIIASQGSSC